MKRILLAAIVGLTALSTVPASAENFVVEGDILVMAPQSKAVGGFTEGSPLNGANCGAGDPDYGNQQGLDGYWITLPEGSELAVATLTTNAVDADVWWYAEGCSGLFDDGDPSNGHYAMATDLTANEVGFVPEGAAFAIVDVAVGANTHFKFEITL